MERRTLLTAAAALATAGVTAACSGGGTSPAGAEGPGTDPSGPPAGTATTTAAGTPTKGAAPGAPSWGALAKGLDGDLVRPGDAAYATARQLYNTRFDTLKPAAVAYVSGEDDIKECLAFARTHRTPVSIRGGGHSYAGWSSGNGRLVIDVSKLDSLRHASDGVVGAGARLADVYRTLAARGRTIPAGSCPTVGVAGLTLGGGHGVAARAYGLTCDSLVSATVITAAGRRLTADATQNKDLFWALRGAGNGNFGVVTELRFRTHPAPATVAAFVSWPWSKAEALLNAWQKWGPDQPDEIWSSLHLAAGPGGGTPTLSLSAFSLGTESDLKNALDRLADGPGGPGPATSFSTRRRGYEEAMLVYAGCSGFTEEQCHLPGTTPGRSTQGALQRETYAAASDFYDRALSPAGLRALVSATERFTRIPASQGGGGGSIALTALGGAVNRVSPLATAFVHRRSRVLAQYIGAWRPGTAGTAQQAWLKSTHASMRRYASGAAYQNYVDPTLTDWRSAYYGGAADRLTRLKATYDPDRLFDFPQAL
ncbi:FAD-binding oxidoreductase [Streptomyces liangshanensis]|uniref:FAD-binding oxidoreductase n=1 Tax=Streptomyces liangshanensis TaxID=2717324 RepID=A0A6G9H0M1_9ACTN|nr:FAD-binding oxidoreductase [Streptomyces liangshanensis]QIQ04024.1 FAD-binding oxidoreductase [Streptomyces liangshanensis]